MNRDIYTALVHYIHRMKLYLKFWVFEISQARQYYDIGSNLLTLLAYSRFFLYFTCAHKVKTILALICRRLNTSDVIYINMKYRSRTEIVAMILEAANGGTTKTKIMYKAFLSYAQLKEYLSVLIENDLIEYIEGSEYKTTQKGLIFLKMNSEIEELLATPTRNYKTIIN
jgi:predicted transcriptional regulator